MSSPPSHRSNPWAVLGVLCLGLFMTLVDMTIVNIALPEMIASLGASLDQALWIFSAYILGFATLLITSGRLGDLYGPRRVYLIGLAVFVAASGLAGLTATPAQLIAARALQGVGGALLAPQLLPIITMVFPPSRWGAAFGATGALSGLAVLVGPTLGGVIVTALDWRWIFYLNLPLGVAAFVLVLRVVHDYRLGMRNPLGLGQVAVLTAGLFCLVFGLTEGERFGWPAWLWALEGAGLLLIAAFALIQHRQRGTTSPLVPVELLGVRNYTLMALTAALVGFAMLGAFLPLTIYLQSVLGLSPIGAGLTIAVMPLMAALIAGVGGRLADARGGRLPLSVGLACFAAGLAHVALAAAPHRGPLALAPGFAVAGIGMGLTFAPLYSVAMKDVRPQQSGVASGLLNTAQELGGLVAGALVGAVLQSRFAAGLVDGARRAAARLPEGEGPAFMSAMESMAARLQVTAPGSGPGPAGAHAETAAAVFRDAYVAAMRPGLLLAVAALAAGLALCALLRASRPAPASAPAPGNRGGARPAPPAPGAAAVTTTTTSPRKGDGS